LSSEFLETTIDKFVLRVKRDLRYSTDHIWVKKENQHYPLGLTDYAQRKGGDIVFLEFPREEGVIKAGGSVARYETIKDVLDAKDTVFWSNVEKKYCFDCENKLKSG